MKKFPILVILLLVCAVVLVLRGNHKNGSITSAPEAPTKAPEVAATPQPQGQALTPTTNVPAGTSSPTPQAIAATGISPVTQAAAPAGSPPIELEKFPGARAAVEALKSGQNPERLNVAFKPKPFDREAFKANPKGYLGLVEPGRIWDVAEPGPGVKDLIFKEQQVFTMKPLGTIHLAVQAEPHAPVTFTSFDFGSFQNQMTSITVQADAQGVAGADYTAVQGTTGDVDVLAASPLSAGQVNFKVTIESKPTR